MLAFSNQSYPQSLKLLLILQSSADYNMKISQEIHITCTKLIAAI